MGRSRIFGAAVVYLTAFGPALAHGGGSFVAPSRVHLSHAQNYHTKTRYNATVLINGSLANTSPYYSGEGVSDITVFSVPTDAQRYMTATGRALPAAHSNILLPPATAKGDYTYIWENNGPE